MPAAALHCMTQWTRAMRSFVLPAHGITYLTLKRRAARSNTHPPYACFDFSSTEIDACMGRYLFHLVRDFMHQGYMPLYRDRYRFLATMRYKKYKRKLLGLPFGIYRDIDQIGGPHLLITDNASKTSPAAMKTIRVDYGERRPADSREEPLPFFVHPHVQSHAAFPPTPDLAAERPVRMFFGGNTNPKKYAAGPVVDKFRMLARVEVLQQARTQVDDMDIFQPNHPTQLQRLNPVVFLCAETQRFRIPFETWLATMQQADFFLACPGAAMPLCHNVIEALACGTIPILQYQDYLHPALVNGRNCLTYHDRGSLAETIRVATTLPQSEVVTLRQGAHAYFREHLRPGALSRRLLTRPCDEVTLLLNAYRVPLAA